MRNFIKNGASIQRSHKKIMNNNREYKIILFDGVCNLCNGAINFIIERDTNNVFRFATLDSEIAEQLSVKYNIDLSKIDSIILISDNRAFIKSSAALHIAKDLSASWPLLYGFMIFPKFIRNAVYDLIAKNRYKWFGKKDSCMVPTAELRAKFL